MHAREQFSQSPGVNNSLRSLSLRRFIVKAYDIPLSFPAALRLIWHSAEADDEYD